MKEMTKQEYMDYLEKTEKLLIDKDTATPAPPSALAVQVGGGHYKSRAIQPIEYIHANNLNFSEGSIVKYITRWRDKGGVKDLEKIKHYVELLIEMEGKYGALPTGRS